MTAQQRLIATARAEIGYLEKVSNAQLDDKTANARRPQLDKYARDLDALGLYNGAKTATPGATCSATGVLSRPSDWRRPWQ